MTLTSENWLEFIAGEGRAGLIASIQGQDIYPSEVYASFGRFEDGIEASSGRVLTDINGNLQVNGLKIVNLTAEASADKSLVFMSEDSGKLSFKAADGSVVSIQ